MAPRVRLGPLTVGGPQLVLIAGPCVIESEAATRDLAARLARICRARKLPLIFKASYDKANRSSPDSYRGPGLEKGLAILKRIKDELKLPLLSDVHRESEVAPAAKVLDVLQIPAFLCRQTDLIQAAAASGRVLNLKKGQFMAPGDMAGAVAKARAAGNRRVLLTERGVSFGYNRLVADLTGLRVMRALGCPVVFDATHSVQLPAGRGRVSGGEVENVPLLARAAVAAGCDAVFLEVHPRPGRARSDAFSQFPLARLPGLLDQLLRIRRAVGRPVSGR